VHTYLRLLGNDIVLKCVLNDLIVIFKGQVIDATSSSCCAQRYATGGIFVGTLCTVHRSEISHLEHLYHPHPYTPKKAEMFDSFIFKLNKALRNIKYIAIYL
jgi:hypothetical protein